MSGVTPAVASRLMGLSGVGDLGDLGLASEAIACRRFATQGIVGGG